MQDSIQTAVGTLYFNFWNEAWQSKWESLPQTEPGIQIIRLELHCDTPQIPPETHFALNFVPNGAIGIFQTNVIDRSAEILPNWKSTLTSMLTWDVPMFTLYGKDGLNRLTMASSDAFRTTKYAAGINEGDSTVGCSFQLFTEPEAPRTDYCMFLRIDTRSIFYADSVRAVFDWYETFPEYKPAETPESARNLLYSSWYSYHGNILAETIEAEVLEAAKYGMKTLILDDGWQSDRHDGPGPYAYCGDWEAVKSKFPDMAKHVKEVHAAGLKYMLWFAVSMLGKSCKNYDRFKHMVLKKDFLGADILDPRFPEVREYLTGIYEKAIKEWDLDGLKLDFIDRFSLSGCTDPAIAENYAGRDCKTVPEGVDKLLSGVILRLKAIKPDVMIEFRQHYMGPAIRKYGNIIRASDCPSDPLSNKTRILALRLSSGTTAVHSDMLSWNYHETPEDAAQQFLAVLFSVPQISVRIEELPQSHRDMLKFWTEFWKAHRTVLLDGYLKPYAPEQSYPLVTAENEQEFFAAVYEEDHIVRLAGRPAITVVNATAADTVTLDSPAAFSAILRDVCGRKAGTLEIKPGLSSVRIPRSGVLERI